MKNKIVLEHQGKEKTYTFMCDPDSPLGELHDAIYAIQSVVIEKMLEEQKRLKESQNSSKDQENACCKN